MKQAQNDYELNGIFPTPVYIVKRDNLDLTEKKEIEDIIKEGLDRSYGNYTSINSYIFNDKLKKLNQFCEEQIRIYVEQVICPKQQKLDWYITQSWLNINKPGDFHHNHSHNNSLISGAFYISTEADDKITFIDPNAKLKTLLAFDPKEFNRWNSPNWFFPVHTNELVLFPSWLEHKVEPNTTATTDRISISFNTFVRGTLGGQHNNTELVLL